MIAGYHFYLKIFSGKLPPAVCRDVINLAALIFPGPDKADRDIQGLGQIVVHGLDVVSENTEQPVQKR